MNNRNNMGIQDVQGNVTVGNDLYQEFINSNQVNKSINVYMIQNQLKETMEWADPLNNEQVLYKRLNNINDRPMLAHYYKIFELKDEHGVSLKTTKSMVFYIYVVKKYSRDNSYVGINLINEFGDKLAAHIILKDVDLSKYVNKLIKFTGSIYPYNEEGNGETKYSVCVFKNQPIDIIEGREHTLSLPPWDMLVDEDYIIDIDELNNKYNSLDVDTQLYLLENMQDKLNVISTNMFNTPNLLYPIILTNFLMRDDIYNEKVIQSNLRFLNIITTIVADYILKIKPKTFDETMKIIVYVILNFLGYNFNTPEDKSNILAMSTIIRVDTENVKEYLKNAKANAGGVQAILNYIPDNYKVHGLGEINKIATIQFLKRMVLELEI